MLGAEFWGKHNKMKIPTLLELSTLVETDHKQIIHHMQVVMKVIQVIKKKMQGNLTVMEGEKILFKTVYSRNTCLTRWQEQKTEGI